MLKPLHKYGRPLRVWPEQWIPLPAGPFPEAPDYKGMMEYVERQICGAFMLSPEDLERAKSS